MTKKKKTKTKTKKKKKNKQKKKQKQKQKKTKTKKKTKQNAIPHLPIPISQKQITMGSSGFMQSDVLVASAGLDHSSLTTPRNSWPIGNRCQPTIATPHG